MDKFAIVLLTMFVATDVSAAFSSSGGRSSSFGSSSVRSSSTSSVSRSSSSSGKASSFGSKTLSSSSNTTKNTTLVERFKANNTTPKKPDFSTVFDRNAKVEKRKSFYSGYSPAPQYQPIIVQHPNYGMFDAMLMWSMLDNMGDRQMYYHHRDEPSFKQWRSDAEKLCADGDKSICNKISELDADVSRLKSQNVKQDITYITDGVDPNIYTADGVSVKDIGEIKICTGTASSGYARFSKTLSDSLKLRVTNIATNGSIDNLDKLSKGYCDMAFAQSDTVTNDNLATALTLDKKEVLLLVCNNNSGVNNYVDLTDIHTIYVGSDQTGSQYTFNNLAKQGFFNPLSIKNHRPTIEAAKLVETEDKSCLFAVDTWDAPYIMGLDASKKAQLVAIDRKSQYYKPVWVDKDHYINLTQPQFKGMWKTGTDSLAVEPTLVATKEWVEKNSVVFYDILMLNRQYLQKNLK